MEKEFNPLVSIVIPVYNGSNYIEESIESALNQDYENIEIIVVNDGSTDDTEKILKKYVDKIKYYNKKNGGVASALNFALNKMSGSYFSWLSHDDLYLPNKISSQIDYIRRNTDKKEAVLYSNYNLIDSDGKITNEVIFDHELLNSSNGKGLYSGSINGITLLIPKKLFDETGFFDESLWCTQDYDKWLDFYLHDYEFIHLDKTLASYRLHAGQTSNISDKALSEGNDLWTKMVSVISDKKRCDLFGSVYKFYLEMANFLNNTPYMKAKEYCENEVNLREEIARKTYIKYKVSVIIPFFNNPCYEVIRAYESVLRQTYKNVELILINDGSSMDYKNLENLIKIEKNIKYLKNEKNRGVAFSRNLGIEKAKGDFIAFLDADDEFLENKIETQLFQMVLNDSVFSHTSYNREIAGKIDYMDSGKVTGWSLGTIMKGCTIATPTVMIKREYLIKNSIKYIEKLNIGEDVCFYLDILKEVPLLGIDEALSLVHANENSSAYNHDKQIEGLKNILRFILNDKELSKYNEEILTFMSNIVVFYDPFHQAISNQLESNSVCLECQRIYNSRSWKFTRPLRLVSAYFRKLFHRNNGEQ